MTTRAFHRGGSSWDASPSLYSFAQSLAPASAARAEGSWDVKTHSRSQPLINKTRQDKKKAMKRYEAEGINRQQSPKPASARNDRHEEDDGGKMKRRREGDELSGKEKKLVYFLCIVTDL
jgi:hypothetical protein